MESCSSWAKNFLFQQTMSFWANKRSNNKKRQGDRELNTYTATYFDHFTFPPLIFITKHFLEQKLHQLLERECVLNKLVWWWKMKLAHQTRQLETYMQLGNLKVHQKMCK